MVSEGCKMIDDKISRSQEGTCVFLKKVPCPGQSFVSCAPHWSPLYHCQCPTPLQFQSPCSHPAGAADAAEGRLPSWAVANTLEPTTNRSGITNTFVRFLIQGSLLISKLEFFYKGWFPRFGFLISGPYAVFYIMKVVFYKKKNCAFYEFQIFMKDKQWFCQMWSPIQQINTWIWRVASIFKHWTPGPWNRFWSS